MNMNVHAFTRIPYAYTHGVHATRPDGITVEVVRCYAGDWNVFLTRVGHVVACSLEQRRVYQAEGCNHLSYQQAMRIARRLLQ